MPAPILHLSLPVRDVAEARRFYGDVLGCEIGRVRDGWLDVWFYGLQLTLHERPDQLLGRDGQGVRHFGVALHDATQFDRLVDRLRDHGVGWITPPTTHDRAGELSGKREIKIADPTGNVIEFKYYADLGDLTGLPGRDVADDEPAE